MSRFWVNRDGITHKVDEVDDHAQPFRRISQRCWVSEDGRTGVWMTDEGATELQHGLFLTPRPPIEVTK